ncbi:hypothetical protein [Sphingopyxis sp.]
MSAPSEHGPPLQSDCFPTLALFRVSPPHCGLGGFRFASYARRDARAWLY